MLNISNYPFKLLGVVDLVPPNQESSMQVLNAAISGVGDSSSLTKHVRTMQSFQGKKLPSDIIGGYKEARLPGWNLVGPLELKETIQPPSPAPPITR